MSEPKSAADGYAAAPNLRVLAADGVEYAYRDVGDVTRPALVLLQHFRGNLDNWTRR